jgi:GT2 family glycosyltransferase
MNSSIELVAIINSFNRGELLEKALASLTQALRQAALESAIVIFDAGSTDGSKTFLDEWRTRNPGDNLVVVESAVEQVPFAEGANIACAAAVAQFPECRWLFFYETDNWLASPEAIEQAVSLLKERSELAAAGFTVRLHNGEPCGYGMSFPTYRSLALGLNLAARWNLDSPNESVWQKSGDISWRNCDVVFTSPLLIRRQAWEQTDGFDAQAFPFSDSDLDWAWRAAQLGWKMVVIASDSVVHDNLRQSSAWSANRVLEFHRSRLRLLKRHRGNRAALIKPFLFLRHCAETALLARASRSDPAAQGKLAKRLQMLRSVWRDYSSP